MGKGSDCGPKEMSTPGVDKEALVSRVEVVKEALLLFDRIGDMMTGSTSSGSRERLDISCGIAASAFAVATAGRQVESTAEPSSASTWFIVFDELGAQKTSQQRRLTSWRFSGTGAAGRDSHLVHTPRMASKRPVILSKIPKGTQCKSERRVRRERKMIILAGRSTSPMTISPEEHDSFVGGVVAKKMQWTL